MASKKGGKKVSLRTSKDVYDRIRWDLAKSDTSDLSQYVIGYLDRFDGICELSFPEYEPGGDIPWHRLYYFRKGTEMLWNRRTKLDKIFGSGKGSNTQTHFVSTEDPHCSDLTPSQSHANSLWPSEFHPVQPASYKFDFDQQTWVPYEPTEFSSNSAPAEHLRIVTFNVLFGLYELGEKCWELARWPLITQLLNDSAADIILLQEITERSLWRLQMESWLQHNYFISEISQSQSAVHPYGQVILSKFPIVETRLCQLNGSKRLCGHLVRLSDTLNLKLINIHLTSTKNEADQSATDKGVQKRLVQLQKGLDCIDVEHSCMALIAGDFNFGDSTVEAAELSALLPQLQMKDVWTEANPTLPGCTFVPGENSIAALTATRHFEPRRLDRIIMRSGANHSCSIVEAKLIGTEATQLPSGHKLFPSDHFGVQVDFHLPPEQISFDLQMLTSMPSVFTTALCLVPPQNGPLYPLVQKLRCKFDPSNDRWQPHVNILHGFVPERYFNEAAQLVQHCCAQMLSSQLPLYLNRFGIFELSNCAYVFLYLDVDNNSTPRTKVLFFPKPNSTEPLDTDKFQLANEQMVDSHPINRLYQRLREFVPLCGDRDRLILVPHMTVGKFASIADAKLAAITWQRDWMPIKWHLEDIKLIAKSAATAFVEVKSVRLGNDDTLLGQTEFSADSIKYLREKAAEGITAQLRDANIHSVPYWIGSVALGTDDVK